MGCPETAHYANIRLFILPITSETIKQRMFCSMNHSECQVQIFQQKFGFLGCTCWGKDNMMRFGAGKSLKKLNSLIKLRMSFTNSEKFHNWVKQPVTLLKPNHVWNSEDTTLSASLWIMQILRDLSNPETTKGTTKPIWGLLNLIGYRKIRKWNHSESPSPNFSRLFSFPLPPIFFFFK